MKKIILINLLVIVLIIVSGEVLIRSFLDITVHGISRGIINYKGKPVFNFPNISGNKAFGKKVYTDLNGFRVTEKFINEKKNKKNIYFVGGSVTFGKGVEQENTFSGILNKEINEFNIINAGVVGSNLENNFEIVKNKVIEKNLENIFINFSLDDLSRIDEIINFTNEKQNKPNTILAKLKNNKILVYVNNFIRTKSVIYIMMKGFIFNSEKAYYENAKNLYKIDKNLKTLDGLINDISKHKLGKKIIFIMIPYSFQLKDKNCEINDTAEKKIIKIFSGTDLKLIRLKKSFCENENKNKIFFKFDPAHLSKYGHSLVADVLKQEIK